ncbi:MAG: hypothetical protein ACRD2B_12855 [Terriglobia bacterium]
MRETFLDFYRCPAAFASFALAPEVSTGPGYFHFGPEIVCFGNCASGHSSHFPKNGLYDSFRDVTADAGGIRLPFDLTQVIDNLRLERYTATSNHHSIERMIREGYYFVRPVLGVATRKHLQKLFLRGWEELPFPRWPLDTTVEQLFEKLMLIALEWKNVETVPFIWFWPDGAPSCVMMTHDVETEAGANFCTKLMDIDRASGIRAAFQIVPEERYPVSLELLESIRRRGFELNVQDLNHDGRLFRNHKTFLARAESINRYARIYGSRGFRAAAMYRNPDWCEALDVSYDLSIPNTAHLEAQRGGCCTVFPYFIGKILELPLTTTQDYSLFHILGEYSIDLWKRQISLIQKKHGLISFIIHPDYIIPERARNTYQALLDHLARREAGGEAWSALPGEVDTWWRARSRMELVAEGGRWVIKGPGSERARVAFAVREGNELVYRFSNDTTASCHV